MRRTDFTRRDLAALARLDRDVADFVWRYTELHHEPPESIGAIVRGMGLHQGEIYQSIRRLERQGILQREKRCRAPVVLRSE